MAANNSHLLPEDTGTLAELENVESPKLVERSIIMPIDSMKHVFRCAFNEIIAKTVTDQHTPAEFYYELAVAIRTTLDSFEEE